MNTSGERVLIVDDDEDVRLAGRLLLSRSFSEVRTAAQPREVPAIVRNWSPDAILLDMNFGRGATSGVEGLQCLNEILRIDAEAAVVVITAHAGIQLAIDALKNGATDFLLKPWENERLVASVKSAIHLRRARRQPTRPAELIRESSGAASERPPLLGVSRGMAQVHSLIARAAPTDANVLILGENGTGKGLVAWELHRLSRRADHPFVAVDLGCIPTGLFESELFGHKKGSYTGADSDRIGRLRAADAGTLFLDEIGNLSLALQPKLLTAMDQRQVVSVGSNSPTPVDVRVVAATNMPQEQLHDESTFRQDLLYRLNTVEIVIPPLRERRDDILPLAQYFLDFYARKYGRPAPALSIEATRALVDYDWPGNVRGLRHAIERAIVLSQGERLDLADFSLPRVGRAGGSATKALPASHGGATLNLHAIEREAIEEALRKHRWNISHSARELGLSRASLYRRMEKYGL